MHCNVAIVIYEIPIFHITVSGNSKNWILAHNRVKYSVAILHMSARISSFGEM